MGATDVHQFWVVMVSLGLWVVTTVAGLFVAGIVSDLVKRWGKDNA